MLATFRERPDPPGRGQWEEFYTQAGRGDDVARFVALILELAESERVHGVLVLRADFYDEVGTIMSRRPFTRFHQEDAENPQAGLGPGSEAKEGDGKMKRKNPHIGSSFEDFLDKEDILEECTNTAIKRVIARQVEQAMKQQGLSKAAMARQMGTSRSALDRLLDPDNASVTLGTLRRAASVVGKRLRLDLVDARA